MISARHIDTGLLPQSLQDIADVIGIAATLKLVEHYGGRRLCVPRRLEPDHQLIEVIGHRAAQALVQTYALERIHVPKAVATMIALRDKEIRRRRGQQSVPSLSAEFGLTERQIYSILAADGCAHG